MGDEDLQSLQENSSLKLVSYKINDLQLVCDIGTGRPRPFIPKPLREEIFKLTHNVSHPSGKVTAEMVSERYVWKNMKSDVKRFCRLCESCQK